MNQRMSAGATNNAALHRLGEFGELTKRERDTRKH